MQTERGEVIRRELRAVRKERKMTLRRLHELTGIAPTTINRIERVEKYPRHNPKEATIAALVGAMGLTLLQFWARIEGLSGESARGISKAHVITREQTNGTHPPLSKPLRLVTDPVSLIAQSAQGSYAVARSIDGLVRAYEELLSELRATREHAASVGVRKTERAVRNRKTRKAGAR